VNVANILLLLLSNVRSLSRVRAKTEHYAWLGVAIFKKRVDILCQQVRLIPSTGPHAPDRPGFLARLSVSMISRLMLNLYESAQKPSSTSAPGVLDTTIDIVFGTRIEASTIIGPHSGWSYARAHRGVDEYTTEDIPLGGLPRISAEARAGHIEMLPIVL
jgi:hypothetical protein